MRRYRPFLLLVILLPMGAASVAAVEHRDAPDASYLSVHEETIADVYGLATCYNEQKGELAVLAAASDGLHLFRNSDPTPGQVKRLVERLKAGDDQVVLLPVIKHSIFGMSRRCVFLRNGDGTRQPCVVATDVAKLESRFFCADGSSHPLLTGAEAGMRNASTAADERDGSIVVATPDIDEDTLWVVKCNDASPPLCSPLATVLNVGTPATDGGTHFAIAFQTDQRVTVVYPRRSDNTLFGKTIDIVSGGSFPPVEIDSDTPSSTFGHFAATDAIGMPAGDGVGLVYSHLDTGELRFAALTPTSATVHTAEIDPRINERLAQPSISRFDASLFVPFSSRGARSVDPNDGASELFWHPGGTNMIEVSTQLPSGQVGAAWWAIAADPPPQLAAKQATVTGTLEILVQLPGLFADGFESGDLRLWSSP